MAEDLNRSPDAQGVVGKRRQRPPLLVLLGVLLGLTLLVRPFFGAESYRKITYSEFLEHLRKQRIEKVEIHPQKLNVVLKAEQHPGSQGTLLFVTRIPNTDDSSLLAELQENDVEFQGKSSEQNAFYSMLATWMIPLALLFSMYYFIFRRLGPDTKGPLKFGRNRAKIYDASKTVRVTFQDVAGIDEAVDEMREVVDFLKNPGKYQALGAKIPKGALLVGAPGTGKTLLAKAVAGEAHVPFFSLSGSDFVEMFVGVGAARVRDLFAQAIAKSPCIIFIDEIDAIGKSRGGMAAMGTHEEREQTLNQLLSEMDGFDPKLGVVIMAATNRPEVLDPALVRSGRFDRQVVVDRPTVQGRCAILEVHVAGVELEKDVDLLLVAKRTPGMVGADLAKVVNEAALAAARRQSTVVEQRDFEESIDRIQLGLKKRGRAMTEQEKHRVAVHEAGHAVVAMSVDHADPVHRVTIIPRAIGALGATLQLPTEERYLMLRNELQDQVAVMFGGRAAEEMILQDVSTGAENDFERATEVARQMVCRFGMSDQLGAQTYGQSRGARFLEMPMPFGAGRDFSEKTAETIDREIRRIVEEGHKRAVNILMRRQPLLESIVARLLVEETLDHKALEALAKSSDDLRFRVHAGSP